MFLSMFSFPQKSIFYRDAMRCDVLHRNFHESIFIVINFILIAHVLAHVTTQPEIKRKGPISGKCKTLFVHDDQF